MRVIGGLLTLALMGCKNSGEIDVGEDTDTGGGETQVGDITVSPAQIDLGLLFVGQSATADITIGNVGNGEVDVRLEVIGGKADVYTLSSYTASPAPDAESVHTLTLTPTTWGDHAVSVLVDDQLDEEGAAEVTVKASVQVDADGDGFGSVESGGADCDDANAQVNPSATETWYDAVDSDCAGDDDFDQDHDGHRADTDCDDTNGTAYPGATDAWYDGVDSDCAGNSDYDQDLDGYDSSANGGADCDDLNEAINPEATETWYDGIDADCDGRNDYDQDGDGSNLGADCDDTNAAAYPGAPEVWYDDVDQACDGGDDWDQDADGVAYPTDCNDLDPSTTGPTTEVMDGYDNDCDGLFDEFGIGDMASGVVYGSSTDTQLGAEGALAMGGDVTNNGRDDLYVGSYNASSYAGSVWVLDGGTASTANGAVGNYDAATASGSTSSSIYYLGSLNGPMGDVNADGIDDLAAVATYGYGYAFVWKGTTSGTLSTTSYALRVTGDSSSDGLGRVVVYDIDGDGVSDVVTATPNDGASSGSWGGGLTQCGNVAFVSGASSLSTTSYTISSGRDDEIHGAASYDYLGYRMAADDLDADGYGDVIVSAYGNDDGTTDGGALYIIEGNSSMSFDDYADDAATVAIYGTSGLGLGTDGLAFPGDFDGDGTLDLAVSEDENAGDVWVFLDAGSMSGEYDLGDADLAIQGDSDELGSALVFADLDNDGTDELIVGADEDDTNGTDAGAVYVYGYDASWGGTATTANATGVFLGAAAGDNLGLSLAGGFDLDGDGQEDLAAGAPGVDTAASGGGAVYIVPGW
jgi:hypothetical protein